jgi:hypothetical protein
MFGIPVAISGAVTIALIVVLGIFVYPLLLRRPGGRVLVTLATVFLVGLFIAFQAATDDASGLSIAVAGLLALAPLIAGIIVARLQSH